MARVTLSELSAMGSNSGKAEDGARCERDSTLATGRREALGPIHKRSRRNCLEHLVGLYHRLATSLGIGCSTAEDDSGRNNHYSLGAIDGTVWTAWKDQNKNWEWYALSDLTEFMLELSSTLLGQPTNWPFRFIHCWSGWHLLEHMVGICS
jgi:hypothetical protein